MFAFITFVHAACGAFYCPVLTPAHSPSFPFPSPHYMLDLATNSSNTDRLYKSRDCSPLMHRISPLSIARPPLISLLSKPVSFVQRLALPAPPSSPSLLSPHLALSLLGLLAPSLSHTAPRPVRLSCVSPCLHRLHSFRRSRLIWPSCAPPCR